MASTAKANGSGSKTTGSSASASAGEVTTDDIRAQIAALQSDVAELTRTVGDYGRSRGDEAKAAAARKAEELKARADMVRHDAETQLRSGYAQAETAVRDNPAAAVGLAAGVGFVLGLLSTRR